MSLLRFNITIGGEKFDSKSYDLAAKKNGLLHGKISSHNNVKKFFHPSTGEIIYRKFRSGITGTDGDKYETWSSAYVEYEINREDFLKRYKGGSDRDYYVLGWLREEHAVIEFLEGMKEKMPPIFDFCKGDYFIFVNLIYGYEDGDCAGGGIHYSENLIKLLSKMNAGISTDSEDFEIHFGRLASLKNK
jgi:hypothetical protein